MPAAISSLQPGIFLGPGQRPFAGSSVNYCLGKGGSELCSAEAANRRTSSGKKVAEAIISDQDAVLGTLTGTHHDGRRRGQSQSAGAGNNEHGNKVQQGEGEGGCWPDKVPDDEGQYSNANDCGHKVAGDDIGQPLDRRLAALSFLHETDNLSQGGIPAYLGCLKEDPFQDRSLFVWSNPFGEI